MDRTLKASTLWVDGPQAASQPHLGCTAQGVAPRPRFPCPGPPAVSDCSSPCRPQNRVYKLKILDTLNTKTSHLLQIDSGFTLARRVKPCGSLRALGPGTAPTTTKLELLEPTACSFQGSRRTNSCHPACRLRETRMTGRIQTQ